MHGFPESCIGLSLELYQHLITFMEKKNKKKNVPHISFLPHGFKIPERRMEPMHYSHSPEQQSNDMILRFD